jgi:hypothetical protein
MENGCALAMIKAGFLFMILMNIVPAGEHELKIIVKDLAGNQTEKNYRFTTQIGFSLSLTVKDKFYE